MMGRRSRPVDERDRTIVAVRDGRVGAMGPPEEIVTPGLLRAVYGIDAEVVTVKGCRTMFFYR
jgi:iron complex transport system ATP-binding protein